MQPLFFVVVVVVVAGACFVVSHNLKISVILLSAADCCGCGEFGVLYCHVIHLLAFLSLCLCGQDVCWFMCTACLLCCELVGGALLIALLLLAGKPLFPRTSSRIVFVQCSTFRFFSFHNK